MTPSGIDRRRQLVTAGIGTVLTLVMGAVLFVGFRIATQMRGNITALQTASALQNYPDDITQQLTSLRDRLEARAYSGKALEDLQGTVRPPAPSTRPSSPVHCSCGTNTARLSSRWCPSTGSRTSTPTARGAPCRARDGNTTPR